jgi:PAS domain S-box-containing protein
MIDSRHLISPEDNGREGEDLQALRESEKRFREMTDALPETVFETDLDGRLLFVNRSGFERFGYTRDDFANGLNAVDMLAPEQRAQASELFFQARETGHAVTERVAVRKDGWRFPVLVHATPIVRDGATVGMRGIVVDLTERKQAEEARVRSEARFRSLVKNAVHGIYRSTLDGRFLEVNPALVNMLGYASEEELTSVPVLALYRDPRDRRILLERFRHSTNVRGVEAEWRRKDGTPIVVRLNGRWVSDDGHPEGFEMIVEDVSERRALEDQLHQAQKMEAVGRLAGGIAHDFNDLLTAILGYSDLLADQVDEPGGRIVEEIRKAADRAAALTRQLLAFSRKQVVQPQAIAVNEVVAAVGPMLQRLVGEDVTLSVQQTTRPAFIKADRGQVEQVLMNLAANARDAMPHGGSLAVETAVVDLDAADASVHQAMSPGRYVMIAVSDNGAGMTDEVKVHLFEPFFTTKEGKGTGLGLATVYGIVRQSGGHIRVSSEVGLGTTFKVYFPCADDDAGRAAGADHAKNARRGHETLLLVEDDEAVRTLACNLLARQGYQVLQADGAEAALRLARQHDGPIDLLITDLVMPHMNGHRLAERVAVLRPDARLLLLSGYEDPGSANATRKGTLLQKPFTRDALLASVRDALDTTA